MIGARGQAAHGLRQLGALNIGTVPSGVNAPELGEREREVTHVPA